MQGRIWCAIVVLLLIILSLVLIHYFRNFSLLPIDLSTRCFLLINDNFNSKFNMALLETRSSDVDKNFVRWKLAKFFLWIMPKRYHLCDCFDTQYERVLIFWIGQRKLNIQYASQKPFLITLIPNLNIQTTSNHLATPIRSISEHPRLSHVLQARGFATWMQAGVATFWPPFARTRNTRCT